MTPEDVAAAQERASAFDIIVAGAIVVRDGGILLCVRSLDDDFLPGYCEIPGGKVDPGETLWDGLHRELKEETSLDIERVIAEIPPMEYDYKGMKVRQCNFVVSCRGEPVLSNEHSAFHWVKQSDVDILSNLLISEKQRIVVDDAFEAVKRLGDGQEVL